GQDLAVGRGVGDHLQLAGHGQGLFDEGRLQLGADRDGSLHSSASWGIGDRPVIPAAGPNIQNRELYSLRAGSRQLAARDVATRKSMQSALRYFGRLMGPW